MPRIREWVGDRVINAIKDYGYQVKNKTYESTIGIPREDIEDDRFGIFAPLFSEMGRSVALFPDELVFPLLTNGFSSSCYDGQNFFDLNHPVLDANGNPVMTANVSTPTSNPGSPWFLLDTTRFVKPLVYQNRRAFEFISKTDPNQSDRVFLQKEYLYGVNGRCNAGFGLWQLAWGSTMPLTRTNFRAAYEAMVALKGDYGRPLGIKPTLFVCRPSLNSTARDLFLTDFIAVDGVPGEAALTSGAGVMSNADKNLVEIFMTPWLA